MERQLVKHGAATLMVSLPKKWLDKQGMQKGDRVEITPLPDKLILSARGRRERPAETSVHFRKADYDEIRNTLGSLYREGYEKILVSYDAPECIYFIQLITKVLSGFEIVEQQDKGCVIKNIMKDVSIDVEEMLNKVKSIIKTEFIIVRNFLEKGIKGKGEEIRMLRDDCWKFRNIIYVHLKDTLLLASYRNYLQVHFLEYNASFLYWLYRAFDRSSLSRASKEFLKLYNETAVYFEKSATAMPDEDYIAYIMKNRDELLRECEKYSLKNANDRFLAIYLGMLVQNIHNPKSIIA